MISEIKGVGRPSLSAKDSEFNSFFTNLKKRQLSVRTVFMDSIHIFFLRFARWAFLLHFITMCYIIIVS